MFLHIGNNQIIQTENIIGVFNIETIENTKEYKRIKEELEQKHKIESVCKKTEQKTFILTKENGDQKGYFSNISSFTIAKRNSEKQKIG